MGKVEFSSGSFLIKRSGHPGNTPDQPTFSTIQNPSNVTIGTIFSYHDVFCELMLRQKNRSEVYQKQPDNVGSFCSEVEAKFPFSDRSIESDQHLIAFLSVAQHNLLSCLRLGLGLKWLVHQQKCQRQWWWHKGRVIAYRHGSPRFESWSELIFFLCNYFSIYI